MENAMMTDAEFDQVLKEAAAMGAEHGRNAAAWWAQDSIGGRASGDTKATARRVLRGLEDGDPEVIDALPSPGLSGEYADDMTPARLMDALDVTDCTPEEEADLCSAYEDAAAQAVQDEVARLCREEIA